MPAQLPSRRVLLIGGSGFVGRRLADAFANLDFDVRIPTRSVPRARRLLVLPEVELVGADVHDEVVLERLLRGCDAAVNLVGILNEPGHRGLGFERAHAELAGKVARACRRIGVRRLLHMSALKADAERGPSHYLRSKGRGERLVLAEQDAVACTLFRPAAIFGAEDSFTTRFARLLRRVPVLPLPHAEARLAPVYVDDVSAAFVAALDSPAAIGRTYELCGPDIYSLREIVRSIARWIRVKRAIVALPDSLGKVQAWIGEYLPGKPFSIDNFASLKASSVCAEDGLAALGIVPHSLGAVAHRLSARRPRRNA